MARARYAKVMLPLKRVLLADADAAARRAWALVIRNKLGGCEVDEAADGEALAAALVACPPDLLLLDWNLPGRPDAATWAAWLQANTSRRLVVLSVDATVAATAGALGAVFIHKGSSAEAAVEQLRALLRAST